MEFERLTIDGEANEEILRQHISRYEFAGQFVGGKRVLDVACGSGYGAAMLKQSGAASLLGIDISGAAVAYAKAQYASEGVTFAVGSAEALSQHGKFDVVTSFETIEHLEHPEIFLAEVARILVPGGTLLISTPVRERGRLEDTPDNPYHLREWSMEEFRALLRVYFPAIEVLGQYNVGRWFPYSRKLQWLIIRLFFPRQFASLGAFSVQMSPPRFAGLRFAMAYMVAVCRASN